MDAPMLPDPGRLSSGDRLFYVCSKSPNIGTRSAPMTTRFLLPVFALAVPLAFGQMGLYGPLTVHLKPGDQAPDIRFGKVLSTPGEAQWNRSKLMGQLTILIFYLNTSRNLETIAQWNSLVDAFADKPVQFLFISGEQEQTLLPWLRQHPIKGWVFHDLDGETGRAYGLELPATVFIGAEGRIAGFGMASPPEPSEVKAALEGRITRTPGTRATLKAFLESGQVLLRGEPYRSPSADEHRPAFQPSYALHVSSSEGEERGNFGGSDFRALKGYSLKEAITDAYAVNSIRVAVPASLDNHKLYDFSIVVPKQESQEKIKAHMQQGIEDFFHLSSRPETRLVETYVVTAVGGRKPPGVKPETSEGMGSESSSIGFQTADGLDMAKGRFKPQSIDSISDLSIDGTADEFCSMLEYSLDRPVVNETNLQGEFHFQLKRTQGAAGNFLAELRDQLGIQITLEQRNIEILVFDPR
jgi:uncharacterized protein (TIGR03435 family)